MLVLRIPERLLTPFQKRIKAMLSLVLESELLDKASQLGRVELGETCSLLNARDFSPVLVGRTRFRVRTTSAGQHR